ncbi:MAG: hypothetical protein WCG79_03680 [Verrucomicrobiota bacterium]|jgi:hypothetical protein
MKTLGFKPDFALTANRFEAWWHGEIVDRPPVTLSVKQQQPDRGPVSRHATLRERWLDVEFVVDSAIAAMETTTYLGDALPVFWPNIGPEITATLYGCELEFGEVTSWSTPVIHDPSDWNRIATAQPDFSNLYWQKCEAMTKLAIERCDGRYLVGLTDLHGAYDILAALREPIHLCTDLLDCPELVDRAARNVARGFAAAFARNRALVSSAGMGSVFWAPCYHAGAAYIPSCDFWCMVSPAMARDLVYPTLVTEMTGLERSIFHLDGPQALPHLDLTLSLPGLGALQWVFGAGHGPASRWLDVYRRARAAGKSLQVTAENAQDALTVLRALGPAGLWFTIDQPFESTGEAEAFLREVARG